MEDALLLITDGFLDDNSEIDLGREVGVSARHLRRLFLDRIGASPTFVAQSRRAHFARRLLDESDLSVGHIAFASGFTSIRQMNRVVKAVFRFSPTQLRARRLRDDPLFVDGGLPLRVPFEAPLDFAHTLSYLAARAVPGVESVEGGTYRRTISIHGEPGVIEVSSYDQRHLLVVAHLPTYAGIIGEVTRVRRFFGLDQDVVAATRALENDPLLGPHITARPGIRRPTTWDPFETAVRVIIGQQITVSGATQIAGRIAERFGAPVDGLERFGLTRLFPSPAVLAKADLPGMPKQRSHTIKSFAGAVRNGDVSLQHHHSLRETVVELQRLPGIGPWTAHLIALRSMDQEDAFPASDLGLRRRAAELLGENSPLAQVELESLADRWRPYRGWAAAHLWAA